MADILKLARIQILIIVLFVILKLIRPTVIDSGSPAIFKIILLSLPNFFEAIIGVFLLTGIGLYVNTKILEKKRRIKTGLIYVIATILAGVYVITQEFKIHNLGGENVFDMIDVLFSIIGLVTGYLIVVRIKPKSI